MTIKITLREIYEKMEQQYNVDAWWNKEIPFEIIVGAILVQNTNWNNAQLALDNLHKRQCLSLHELSMTNLSDLQTWIRPSGFYKQKGTTLKQIVDMLVLEYKGNLELFFENDTNMIRNQLLKVKGIGFETADDIILYAANKPMFVVDKYTIRILSRIGIIRNNLKYQAVQDLFHENLPKDTALFQKLHALFVSLGQDVCKTKPLCHTCCLNSICESNLKNLFSRT